MSFYLTIDSINFENTALNALDQSRISGISEKEEKCVEECVKENVENSELNRESKWSLFKRWKIKKPFKFMRSKQ